jgi:selina-4(15),7(11)-diene synthase
MRRDRHARPRALPVHPHVASDADPQLLRYLSGLSSWIRGHLDWGMSTARYVNPEDPADLPGQFAARPYDDSDEPLPIPSIAWWWGQLPAARQPLARAA